ACRQGASVPWRRHRHASGRVAKRARRLGICRELTLDAGSNVLANFEIHRNVQDPWSDLMPFDGAFRSFVLVCCSIFCCTVVQAEVIFTFDAAEQIAGFGKAPGSDAS